MADEGWEARMAARARERERKRRAAEVAAAEIEWQAEHAVEMRRLAGDVTLAEAVRRLHPGPRAGCACIGPPNCCMDVVPTCRALKHGAHVMAKLIVSRMEALADG